MWQACNAALGGPETAALTPVIFDRRTESVSCQTDSETVLLVASARFFSLLHVQRSTETRVT